MDKQRNANLDEMKEFDDVYSKWNDQTIWYSHPDDSLEDQRVFSISMIAFEVV